MTDCSTPFLRSCLKIGSRGSLLPSLRLDTESHPQVPKNLPLDCADQEEAFRVVSQRDRKRFDSFGVTLLDPNFGSLDHDAKFCVQSKSLHFVSVETLYTTEIKLEEVISMMNQTLALGGCFHFVLVVFTKRITQFTRDMIKKTPQNTFKEKCQSLLSEGELLVSSTRTLSSQSLSQNSWDIITTEVQRNADFATKLLGEHSVDAPPQQIQSLLCTKFCFQVLEFSGTKTSECPLKACFEPVQRTRVSFMENTMSD
mmetsp:Transcript_61817/g.70916  ORF Transcript_61817/g.70916 Transcript_61817/m.70916 type:complete len:256 (-) Transcript_61817:524-1291(-)